MRIFGINELSEDQIVISYQHRKPFDDLELQDPFSRVNHTCKKDEIVKIKIREADEDSDDNPSC